MGMVNKVVPYGQMEEETIKLAQKNLAESIMRAVGITQWVDDEALMDAVTALSGSGPAYFFLFMEAMVDAGCRLGLERDVATHLALQTGLGAARMALENDSAPCTMIGERQFGSTVMNISRRNPAPATRGEVT